MRLLVTLVFLLSLPSGFLLGQQLILFKREKVMARFSYGDDFAYKLKKSNHYTKSFVTDVREFSVITFNDTVKFSDIDRVSLRGHPQQRFAILSKVFITVGIGYFVIDQFNNIVVQGNKPDLEPSVWRPSVAALGVGLALKFIRQRSQRIRFPARLFMAERGSRFYKYED